MVYNRKITIFALMQNWENILHVLEISTFLFVFLLGLNYIKYKRKKKK